MILTNVFLSIAMFFNTMNVHLGNRSDKEVLSVEKNDILILNLNENLYENKNIPSYFLNHTLKEYKPKGILNKNFDNEFNEFYASLNMKLSYLHKEIDNLSINSQAYSSEYVFHRKNHIKSQLESLIEKIDKMSIKDRRKLIYYEYVNEDIKDYDGLLGFSIIYNDKYNPSLVGTIVMPKYIGELETLITHNSINTYKFDYRILTNNFYAEPLSYFDRYYLTTVGFK